MSKAEPIVLVFGAGITGTSYRAMPNQECRFALKKAVEIAEENHCTAVAFPGWSDTHKVIYGKLMNAWLRSKGVPILGIEDNDYDQKFNTLGECRAFWKYMAMRQISLDTVFTVTRGVHSYRSTFLLKQTQPEMYKHVTIVRVQAESTDLLLPPYEIAAWIWLAIQWPKLRKVISQIPSH